jgi:Carboxypeptidase regulatory-like domain/Photosynthesis system II assembly factor YCF48
MQDVPKIVRERLKVVAPAVNHPDADVLTAFAERSLLEKERAVVLEHLARCGDCRDIVALALPAAEPIQAVVRPSPGGWLTWPVLRWGFVAAAIVAVASFGLLQYQRRPANTAVKQLSPTVEVAANEPKKSVAPFAAGAPTEKVVPAATGKKEKLQSPAAPAFSGSFDAANAAANEKKTSSCGEAAPAQVPSQARSFPGAAGITGNSSRSGGPRLANQWPQQNMVQNQISAPAAQNGVAKQQAAGGDMSAGARVPTVNQTVEVSAAGPATVTESANGKARLAQNQPASQPLLADAYGSVAKYKAAPQAALGQIVGYVVDPSGAVVSNARITITPSAITSSKAGASATAVTNSQGAWLIAGLPSGNYKAQAEAQGFKTTVLDFNYDANHPSKYNLTLNPGSVSETVEVSAAEVQVPTQGAVGGLITNTQVSQIPISGRNLTQLATVAPVPRWTINASGALQRSFDQGNSWQTVDVNANPAAAGANFAVAAAPSRAKAKDADKALKRDAANPTFRAVAATGSDVWAGGSAGALFHSTDAGNHWTRVVPVSAGAILTGDIISLEFADLQHGRVSTSTPEVWTTSDGGQTWQKQ